MLVLWKNRTSQERLMDEKEIRGKIYEGIKLVNTLEFVEGNITRNMKKL
jgi:hypothetical protein